MFAYDKRSLLKQLDQTYQNPALSPATSVQRTYDGYGALVTEQVYVGGVLKDSWLEAHDAAGRRIQLKEVNNPTKPFTYKYQADGRLVETVFNNDFYDYSYTDEGWLNWRGTPLHTQNIARDSAGRITMASQSVYGTTLLSETISWRGDSTQNSNAISRAGTLYENRSYAYDVRGHVLQESFTPQAGYTGSATYKFDGGTAGGLGLRTNATLGNAYSGSNTQSYSGVAQLTQASTTGSFVGALGASVTQAFDATGQVTSRAGSTATDTMTWDALGRLVGVTRRNSANSGFNWSAVYDGLNRRLQTTQQAVTGGALTGTALTLKSSYDPEVEFLELAVTSPTARYWKVHGPDLNGKYGGLQGTGGLEAVYNGTTGVTTSIMNDTYGSAEVTLTASGSGISYVYNPVAGSGYGSAPGGLAAVPMDGVRDLGSVIAWRGHYVDGTGYYYMGMRYYAQDTGGFLSPDPLGHAACMDLYSYGNGDPVNRIDPDGRFGYVTVSGSTQKNTQILTDLYKNPPPGVTVSVTSVGNPSAPCLFYKIQIPNPTLPSFRQIVSQLPENSIAELRIGGHGTPESVGIDPSPNGKGGGIMIADTGRNTRDVRFTDNAGSFPELIEPKLASGGAVFLDACDTANENSLLLLRYNNSDNIAKALSDSLPGHPVTGGASTIFNWPNRYLGNSDYSDGTPAKGARRTYFTSPNSVVDIDPNINKSVQIDAIGRYYK